MRIVCYSCRRWISGWASCESQPVILENIVVGRSLPFVQFRSLIRKQVSFKTRHLFELYYTNNVKADCIRLGCRRSNIQSHIAIRWDREKYLEMSKCHETWISGTIEWSNCFLERTQIKDSQGVLQDTHWVKVTLLAISSTYTLGNLVSVASKMQRPRDYEEDIMMVIFSIREWLRLKMLHQHDLFMPQTLFFYTIL